MELLALNHNTGAYVPSSGASSVGLNHRIGAFGRFEINFRESGQISQQQDNTELTLVVSVES